MEEFKIINMAILTNVVYNFNAIFGELLLKIVE